MTFIRQDTARFAESVDQEKQRLSSHLRMGLATQRAEKTVKFCHGAPFGVPFFIHVVIFPNIDISYE